MRYFLCLFSTFFFLSSCSILKVKKPFSIAPKPQEIQSLRKIQRLYKKNFYKQALRELGRVKKNSGIYLDALYLKGMILLKQHQYKKAQESFLKVVNSPFYFEKEASALYLASFSTFHIEPKDLSFVESLCQRTLNHSELSQIIEIKVLKLMVHVHKVEQNTGQLVASLNRLRVLDGHEIYKNLMIKILNEASLEELKSITLSSDYGEISSWAGLKIGEYYWNLNDLSKAQDFLQKAVSYEGESVYKTKALHILESLKNKSASQAYTIGVVLPLSGKTGIYGQRALKGLLLGLGIFGDEKRSKFSLAIRDSEGNSERAETVTYDLLKQEKPIAIVGDLLGKTSKEVAKVSQKFLTPNITFSQKYDLTKNSPFVFRYALTSKKIVEELVRTTLKLRGLKKFAILYPNDKYGVEYANLFWDEVLSQGGEVVAVQTYNAKTPRLNDAIKRLTGTFYIEDRKNEYRLHLMHWYSQQKHLHHRMKVPEILPPLVRFDALFLPDRVQNLIQTVATLKYQDIENIMLLGTNLWNTPELFKKGGKMVEGVVFPDLSFDPKFFKNTVFYQLYKKTFGKIPTILESQAYDVGLILRQLILSGSNNREELSKKLSNLYEFPGTFGLVSTSKERNIIHSLKVLTLKKGKIVPFF